ncbi:MAG TPA: endonuclease [Synergistaceae bacterium]|mgnify:CR=1 FL=1|nr:endonuclease [Synergistaceae bacterium]HPQ37812.1 endonuclease [Synergistaceae bacterium]
MKAELLLGIDPGREKFGWAFGTFKKGFLCSGIGKTPFFPAWVVKILEKKDFSALRETLLEGDPDLLSSPGEMQIILGSGTGSAFFEKILRQRGCLFSWGEEGYTTLEARKMFWELHPPRGIRRLFPKSLFLPPRSLDDLAAWCIVKRAFFSQNSFPEDSRA